MKIKSHCNAQDNFSENSITVDTMIFKGVIDFMVADDIFLDLTRDCNIVIDSRNISMDDVIQSLCEEYVKYKLPSTYNEHAPIVVNNGSVDVSSKVKINSASEDELKKLPGINLVHAKKIIQSRDHNNYVNSFDDLIRLGIDPVSVDNLKDLIIIDKVIKKRHISGGRVLDL